MSHSGVRCERTKGNMGSGVILRIWDYPETWRATELRRNEKRETKRNGGVPWDRV
jgi:hypothetical protein